MLKSSIGLNSPHIFMIENWISTNSSVQLNLVINRIVLYMYNDSVFTDSVLRRKAVVINF